MLNFPKKKITTRWQLARVKSADTFANNLPSLEPNEQNSTVPFLTWFHKSIRQMFKLKSLNKTYLSYYKALQKRVNGNFILSWNWWQRKNDTRIENDGLFDTNWKNLINDEKYHEKDWLFLFLNIFQLILHSNFLPQIKDRNYSILATPNYRNQQTPCWENCLLLRGSFA